MKKEITTTEEKAAYDLYSETDGLRFELRRNRISLKEK